MNRSKSDYASSGRPDRERAAASLTETAPSRVEEARASLLRAPRHEDAGRLARSTQISEILDRQKLLSRNRPPPPAAANLSLADQIRERLRSGRSGLGRHQRPPRRRHPPQRLPCKRLSPAVCRACDGGTFPRALAKLRARPETGSGCQLRPGNRQSAQRDQGNRDGGGRKRFYPQDLYADLQRLAEGMEYLGEATENAVANSVRGELDSIRAWSAGWRVRTIWPSSSNISKRCARKWPRRTSAPTITISTARSAALPTAIEMLVSQMSNARPRRQKPDACAGRAACDVVAAIEANARPRAELSGDAGSRLAGSARRTSHQEIDAVNLQPRDNLVASASRVSRPDGRLAKAAGDGTSRPPLRHELAALSPRECRTGRRRPDRDRLRYFTQDRRHGARRGEQRADQPLRRSGAAHRQPEHRRRDGRPEARKSDLARRAHERHPLPASTAMSTPRAIRPPISAHWKSRSPPRDQAAE